MSELLKIAFAASSVAAPLSSAMATPSTIAGVYEEVVSQSCSAAPCVVPFSLLGSNLVITDATCSIRVPVKSGSTVLITAVQVGDTSSDTYHEGQYLSPYGYYQTAGNYQYTTVTARPLHVESTGMKPAIRVEFSAPTASFVRCSIAGMPG